METQGCHEYYIVGERCVGLVRVRARDQHCLFGRAINFVVELRVIIVVVLVRCMVCSRDHRCVFEGAWPGWLLYWMHDVYLSVASCPRRDRL